MSTHSDQLWGWIYQPLHDMQEKCRAEPGVAWDVRLAQFLDELKLSSAEQNPVTDALVERVRQESDPIAFVSDSNFESIVYGLVLAKADAQERQPELAAQAQPEPVVARDPATVADNSVVAIGLPAVRALVAAQPGLTAGTDLAGPLATALAYRLTAQAQPAGTAVSTALAGYLEQQLSANPAPAGEFYALFGQDVNLAYQWVTRQVSAHAGEIPRPVPVAAPAETLPEKPATAPPETPVDDLFAVTADTGTDASSDTTYLMPELVEEFLRDVPGADILTPEQINDAIREVLAENQGGQS